MSSDVAKTGRNLPAAIATGLGLVAIVFASLLWRKEVFVLVASATVALALVELSQAFRRAGVSLPTIPLIVGTFGMITSAYYLGPEGLVLAFALTVAISTLWRLFDGTGDAAVRDSAAAAFAAGYLPFLAGFLTLMAAEPDGATRTIVALLLASANDTGGFITGSLFGKHPIAPAISPKKSWEGAAGSFLLAAIVGTVGVWLLHGPLWVGVLLGMVAVVFGTLGDFSESLIKRSLNLKDMGSLLPGHGGVMDRIDSVVFCAPAVYVVLSLVVPVG